jgi:hypothetical protein
MKTCLAYHDLIAQWLKHLSRKEKDYAYAPVFAIFATLTSMFLIRKRHERPILQENQIHSQLFFFFQFLFSNKEFQSSQISIQILIFT